MSVAIQDVLHLSSMKGSVLLTKSSELKRTVNIVSVLEYLDTIPMQKDLSENIKYAGNELTLTVFASISHDVDARCKNIQQLSSAEDIDLILVGNGKIIVRGELVEASKAYTDPNGGVANAIGATIAQVGVQT